MKREIENKAERKGVKESAKSEFIKQTMAYKELFDIVNIKLDAETIAEGLIENAKSTGGCMGCVHSRPDSETIDRLDEDDKLTPPKAWQVRTCVLGLSQDKCNAYKPII